MRILSVLWSQGGGNTPRTLITGGLGQLGRATRRFYDLWRLISDAFFREKHGKENVVLSDIVRCPSKDVKPYVYADTLAEENVTRGLQVNETGFQNIVEVCSRHGLSLFCPSTIGAFGPTSPRNPTPDLTIQRPHTIYGVTKVYMELLGEYYHHKFGVDFRSLQFPGVISADTAPGGGTTDYAVHIFHAAKATSHYRCFLRDDTMLPMMFLPDFIWATIKMMAMPAEKLKSRVYNITAMSFTPAQLVEEMKQYYPHLTCPKLSDMEREKAIIELDMKELISRHRMDMTEKIAWLSQAEERLVITVSCMDQKQEENQDSMANFQNALEQVEVAQKEAVDAKSQLKKLETPLEHEKQLKTEQITEEQRQRQDDALRADLFSGKVKMKWEKAASAPVGRCGHSAVALNGLVFVGGGIETGGNVSFVVDVYNPVEDKWGSPIEAPRCGFGMTVLNNKVVIVGGKTKKGEISRTVRSLERSSQWEEFTSMPTARYNSTAVGYNSMLLAIGGTSSDDVTIATVELYDTKKDRWYKCDDLPKPHSFLQPLVVKNTLYLLGGHHQEPSPAVLTAPLNTVTRHRLRFNYKTPTPFVGSAVAVVAGKLVITLGGEVKIRTDISECSEVCALNASSSTWEAIGQLPAGRCVAAAASLTDDLVILIGGRTYKEQHSKTVLVGSFDF